MKASTKKALIWSAVIVVAGVGGYFGWKYLIKKDETSPEDETDYETETSPDDYSSGGKTVSDPVIQPDPEPTPADVKAASFKEAKKAMGIRRKDFSTYATLLTDATKYGLQGGGGNQGYLVVNSDGIWRLFFVPAGKSLSEKQMLAKGRYYKGGKRLIVGWGKNKGMIVEGKNLGSNLKRIATT